MIMLNNLTALDQLVLASAVGGTLGSGLCTVAGIFQQRAKGGNINHRKMMLDSILGSLAMGLLSGGMVFAFASIDVQSIERVTPLNMFTLCFVAAAYDYFARVVKLILSRVSQ
jgi:hypothetical protein